MSGHSIETEDFVIVVDKWDASYLRRAGNKAHYFFLTHLHADHIKGLTSTWSRIVYTSPFNAWLLPIRRNVRPELLRPLDLSMTHTILKPRDGAAFQVTVLNANHCPGSVMFLFQGSFGNILYTGDFRYQPGIFDSPPLKDVVRKRELHKLYLDNTYAATSCIFPSREEALEQVLKIIDEHPDYKVLIGMRQLGKEEVLRSIALHIKERICVSPQRLQILTKLEYEDVFTTDTAQSRVHAVELHTITHRHAQENTRVISIKLTSMYECSNIGYERKRGNIYVVPYSDHSNHSEIVQCVRELRPHQILPIVVPKVFDSSKDTGPWSKMSTVNCVIPDSILGLCGTGGSPPISPQNQRASRLSIKFHLKGRDQQRVKHTDEGSAVIPLDVNGPQLTLNNIARRHIKASWTRLAPILLSQKGITFNESSSVNSDSLPEAENLCNGTSSALSAGRVGKRKRESDPRSPLAAQNKASDSDGEGSLLEVLVSGDEDEPPGMPTSAVELQQRLQGMKSTVQTNGTKINGTDTTSEEAKDVSSSSHDRSETEGSVCVLDSEGTPSGGADIANRETDGGRRKFLARSVKQSPPEKTDNVSMTKKAVGAEKVEKTKKPAQRKIASHTENQVEKTAEKKTTEQQHEAESNDKEVSRVIKLTRRSVKEVFGEGAKIDNIPKSILQRTESRESIFGISLDDSIYEGGSKYPLQRKDSKESLSKRTNSKDSLNSDISNIEKSYGDESDESGLSRARCETVSPSKKRLSASSHTGAALLTNEDFLRKQAEKAIKALQALDEMKGFKTRGNANRTKGGLKVSNEVIALRRISGENNPIISPSTSLGPKIRSRKASILSSMATNFEKEALKNVPDLSESLKTSRKSSGSKSLRTSNSPTKLVPPSQAKPVMNGDEAGNTSKEDSLLIGSSVGLEDGAEAVPKEDESVQVKTLSNEISLADSSSLLQCGQRQTVFNPEDQESLEGETSLSAHLLKIKVDIAMNATETKTTALSLPAKVNHVEESARTFKTPSGANVQDWRSKITSLKKGAQNQYKSLKLRQSKQLKNTVNKQRKDLQIRQESSGESYKGDVESALEDTSGSLCEPGTETCTPEISAKVLLQKTVDDKVGGNDHSGYSGDVESELDSQRGRRHSPRLLDTLSPGDSKKPTKGGKLVENISPDVRNDEEQGRRHSLRISKDENIEPSSKKVPSKAAEKGMVTQLDKRHSLRLSGKDGKEGRRSDPNQYQNPKGSPNANPNPNANANPSPCVSPSSSGNPNPKSDSNPKSVAEKKVAGKRQFRRGKEQGGRMSVESNSGVDKDKKCSSKRLSTKDSKSIEKSSMDPSGSPEPVKSSANSKLSVDHISNDNASSLLSFGDSQAQKTVNILSQMRETFEKTHGDIRPSASNILKSMADNFQRLTSANKKSSMSLELLPKSPATVQSDPTPSNSADWSIHIVPISNSPESALNRSRNSQGGSPLLQHGLPKSRLDVRTPEGLSIKLMTSDKPSPRKEPSPPSLSISVADDPDVVILSEGPSPLSSTISVRSLQRSFGGQRGKLQGASKWSQLKCDTSMSNFCSSSKTPLHCEQKRLRGLAPPMVQPPPQAIWKENRNERHRKSDVVVVDIETEQDHCPVHCTCGQAKRKKEELQGPKEVDQDSDSSSVYEVPLSPEDFEASRAMVAFGEGWLDVCFDDKEDREEFLASYEPYLPKVVHQPFRMKEENEESTGSNLFNSHNHDTVPKFMQSIPLNSQPPRPSAPALIPTLATVPPRSPSVPPSPPQQQQKQKQQPQCQQQEKEEAPVISKPKEVKPRKSSTDSERSDSLLKEIEKKIRAYNEQQSKKRARDSEGSRKNRKEQGAGSNKRARLSSGSTVKSVGKNTKSSPKQSQDSSPSSSDGPESRRTRRRTEVEALSEVKKLSPNKSPYRKSVRRSLDHLTTRQKLRSEKRIVNPSNHS